MKYNVVISRTYATELVVDAENIQEVHDWLGDNDDKVNHEELEQCNIIDIQFSIGSIEPSPNEALELQSLSVYIQRLIQEYRHVEDFVPKELHEALAKMMLRDED